MAGFDSAAATYDRSRHAMIPDFDVLYGTAVNALPFTRDDAIRVLDLGCGTGALAGEVVNAFPRSSLVLSDVSAQMLARARDRFAGDERFAFVEQDCITGCLDGPYDAVVSSLMIHHLEHADKRAVFARVFDALKPGGMFVNIDQFAARSERVHGWLFSRWLADVRAGGALEEDIEAALARMRTFDRNAAMQDQFDWLEHAGFRDVDIAYRRYFWAVFTGVRAAS